MTLTLTDGGVGDADGVANGVIDDPVGLATPVAASSPESSGGGCAVAGTGGGPADAVGTYGILALIALGLLARKAVPWETAAPPVKQHLHRLIAAGPGCHTRLRRFPEGYQPMNRIRNNHPVIVATEATVETMTIVPARSVSPRRRAAIT